MRIVLVTCGSRGDVQPILTLALGLQDAGHDVLVAGPPEKAAWAAHLGCPFVPLGRDLTAFVDALPNVHSLMAVVRFVTFVRGEVRRQFEELPPILVDADLVIGASLALGVSSVAEKMGLAYRYVVFAPQLLESGRHPHPLFAWHGQGPVFNRLTWWLGRIMDKINFTAVINNQRRLWGMKPLTEAWPHVLSSNPLVASDAEIAGIPDDVQVAVIQPGYLHLRQPRIEFPQLLKFMESGSPPIYSGFGSMPRRDQARNADLVITAARAAGRRLVMSGFWHRETGLDDTGYIFYTGPYPHLDLFPYMAAVIHHGGAGTTAAAAISGVPQIIVAHALDQYYWGYRVQQRGLGPKPLWRSRLTGHRLTKAIEQALSDRQMQSRARALAKVLKARDALSVAVDAICNH